MTVCQYKINKFFAFAFAGKLAFVFGLDFILYITLFMTILFLTTLKIAIWDVKSVDVIIVANLFIA